MVDVFLLLGSNLGDRSLLLKQAIEYIAEEIAPIIKQSAIYETQSWGKTDSPDYLNQVILIQTEVPAQTILQKVLNIEWRIGRVREEKWGPRLIDIDILFYGDDLIDEPELKVPHPELHKRRFTLEPLAEIAPYFIHPTLNKNILQLKSELKDNLIVKKF
ncbi:MAG: 2-amino-4-hydroxy-6-hydroxymethyldihydropteridine diphosphokinase [Sphingobacteriaceae bacterium]|nr:MAG: 2-amino-4-hydroxy-6-hydroxymethyldihydropteridine diphosphokinase [Sphingobacteriaceae bacterium]